MLHSHIQLASMTILHILTQHLLNRNTSGIYQPWSQAERHTQAWTFFCLKPVLNWTQTYVPKHVLMSTTSNCLFSTDAHRALGGVYWTLISVQYALCWGSRICQTTCIPHTGVPSQDPLKYNHFHCSRFKAKRLTVSPSPSSAFPAISLGFTIFGLDFCLCDRFSKSNHRRSHIKSSWMVHAGCVFVPSIQPSRTWMSGSSEFVGWNRCVHRIDLSLYPHPKESFSGSGVRTHANSKGKIPSTRGSEEGWTRDAASRRTASPTLPTEQFQPWLPFSKKTDDLLSDLP